MADIPELGCSAWFDLLVQDLADAMSFYEGLLGWTYQQMEKSPLADYVMIQAGGKLIGGLRKAASPRAGAGEPGEALSRGPVLYFTVADLNVKTARAKELGAKLIGPVIDLGNHRGRYQWIGDREGHMIGLWSPT